MSRLTKREGTGSDTWERVVSAENNFISAKDIDNMLEAISVMSQRVHPETTYKFRGSRVRLMIRSQSQSRKHTEELSRISFTLCGTEVRPGGPTVLNASNRSRERPPSMRKAHFQVWQAFKNATKNEGAYGEGSFSRHANKPKSARSRKPGGKDSLLVKKCEPW